MKTLSLLILILFCTISAMAQPWIGTAPGNIYYNSGNVGIGTTNPVYPLDVVGTIKSRATIWDKTGILLGNVASEQPKIEFNASDNSARFKLQVNGVNTSNERLSVYAGPIGCTATTETLIIGGNGNIGIGTTNPEAKLTVKGKIVASEIQVKDVGAIPDYVFKPDYELMPLSHVEEFVKQNQHLPEVPSEKEFKENGMNMAEMNALLLKKVEELTLYVIEQSKQTIEQNKQINLLKEENKAIRNLIAK